MFPRTRTEQNPNNEGSFPSLLCTSTTLPVSASISPSLFPASPHAWNSPVPRHPLQQSKSFNEPRLLDALWWEARLKNGLLLEFA